MGIRLHSSEQVELTLAATTEGIFKKIYKVRIPEMYVFSIQEMAVFGQRMSGNPHRDNDFANTTRLVYLPVCKMATIYDLGGSVGVVQEKDTVEIYKNLQQHLTYWTRAIERIEPNAPQPPLEDLLILEEFARNLFKHVRHHHTEEKQTSNERRTTFSPNSNKMAPAIGEDGHFKRRNDNIEGSTIISKYGNNRNNRSNNAATPTPTIRDSQNTNLPTRRNLEEIIASHAGKQVLTDNVWER